MLSHLSSSNRSLECFHWQYKLFGLVRTLLWTLVWTKSTDSDLLENWAGGPLPSEDQEEKNPPYISITCGHSGHTDTWLTMIQWPNGVILKLWGDQSKKKQKKQDLTKLVINVCNKEAFWVSLWFSVRKTSNQVDCKAFVHSVFVYCSQSPVWTLTPPSENTAKHPLHPGIGPSLLNYWCASTLSKADSTNN